MDNQQSQTPTAGTPIYQESAGEKNAKWLWVLIVIIIVGALAFAFVKKIGPFARFASTSEVEALPSPFVFSNPTPSPEATSGAEVNRSEPKIRVLNGSGTAGLASVVKDFLESRGWKVVAIGNADNYDFQKTTLKFKEKFIKFEKTLTSDLSSKYSVTTADSLLEATDSADIEIIVGSK